MNLSDFEIDVDRTANPALTDEQKIAHAIAMLGAEAGEVLGIHQKTFQGQGLRYDKLKDELGDVLFALIYVAHSTGISLDDIMSSNVEKRRIRYPDGFDAKRGDWRASILAINFPPDGWRAD